jgi:uncharacterized delta-60 repeat protein
MKSCIVIVFYIFLTFSAFAFAEQSPLQQWVSRFDGTGNFDDIARAVTSDSAGNVYVTGKSFGVVSYDFITTKYDSAGNQLWIARYDNPSHDLDDPAAIAVDNSGNVYVTGTRNGGGINLQHYATVKYSPDGNQLWVSYYTSGKTTNIPRAIAVDTSGNVYVTGISYTSTTVFDYATVKYDTNGNELWVSRYTGLTSSSSDSAEAIAIDSSGNVYVTGSSGSSSKYDYATIKYNSSGVQQWVARYNGDANSNDAAYTIAVDSSSNVYVGGRSTGIGTAYDYATVKYNSSGTQQWVARYNGPSDGNDRIYKLVLDSSSNVYVTGESDGIGSSLDFATIKYNSSGVQQWIARYNGPGNGSDSATSIAVDDSGNTYITGKSAGTDSVDYATVKYNSAGAQVWAVRYDGPANGLDAAYSMSLRGSYICITGESTGYNTYQDFATIKYDLNGNQSWVARYSGQGHTNDAAYGMTTDDSGNVYVTGTAGGPSNSYDLTTIKYSPDGNLLWLAQYDFNHFTDAGHLVAVDHNNNVYVTGRCAKAASPSSYDFITVKYDPNGSQLWGARYDGPGNGGDMVNGLAVDTLGNVYIAGESVGSGTTSDYATIKYGPDGNQLWAARFDGPVHYSDSANALAIDSSGNVYVTGECDRGSSSTYSDYVTIKYDSNGTQVWLANYIGPLNYDEARDIAVDNSGNVYVTGSSAAFSTSDDYVTVKYNSAGVQQWAKRYNGPSTNKYDLPYDLALDNAGNVYVTGYSEDVNGYEDFLTVKYSSDGNLLWAARYDSPSHGTDFGYKLAVDRFQNVYVTGISDDNYVTIKYDSNGNRAWLMTYDGPGSGSDSPWFLTIDNFGSVYVTGQSTSARGDNDIATIKYTQRNYCFETLAGDLNGDCIVEFTDLVIMGDTWRAGYDLLDLEKLADDWLICNLAVEGECW